MAGSRPSPASTPDSRWIDRPAIEGAPPGAAAEVRRSPDASLAAALARYPPATVR